MSPNATAPRAPVAILQPKCHTADLVRQRYNGVGAAPTPEVAGARERARAAGLVGAEERPSWQLCELRRCESWSYFATLASPLSATATL